MIDFLIVGAFPKKNSEIIGGQVTACKNLFPKYLYNKKNIIRFDTTQKSNPPPNLFFRFYLSIKRFPLFLKIILFKKPKKVIILASSGTSFIEKVVYLLISKLIGHKTVFIPRSDLIIKQIQTKIIYRIFFKLMLYSTNHFIFQSSSFLVAFKRLEKKKYTILPNCIKISRNHDISEKKIFPEYEINLLFVGWIEPIKNLPLLFKAVKISEKLLPERKININIVGEGSQLYLLKKLSKELTLNTKFYGWINSKNKLEEIYMQSDCFCLPSKNEGFPNVVLEAMYYGLPIISSEVGGLPFWFEEGKNILFSGNEDPNNFALNILKLFTSRDLYFNLSKNNFNDLRNRFDCKRIAKDLKTILKNIH